MIKGLQIAALVSLAAGLGGCLERDVTITSEPAGALVFLNDKEVGRTPVTVPFLWYGDYDVILRLDGHKTITTHAKINPPLQETPPADLFCEIMPWTIYDHRYLDYKMEQAAVVGDEELLRRAKKLSEDNLKPVK